MSQARESLLPDAVDLLIVGSGPAGAAFARIVTEQLPQATVLMVDVGPRLSDIAGENTRNLPPEQRARAQAASQGPHGSDRPTSPRGQVDGKIAARPGTFLVSEFGSDRLGPGPGAEAVRPDPSQSGMPAAAMSSNVGGMSAHWTCACPAPGGSERNPYLEAKEFDAAFARAHELLSVTTTAFRPTPVSSTVLQRLGGLFDEGRDPERRVQPMPLACRPSETGRPFWSGSAQVLGPLAAPGGGAPAFRLSPDTLCRRLLLDDEGSVTGAELELTATGERARVAVRAVVVAADALRTPQLLWASGIRLPALGRYLNDQPQIIGAVVVEVDDTGPAGPAGAAGPDGSPADVDRRDQLTGVLWVPFVDGSHPFHSQVMQLDASPIGFDAADDPRDPVVGLGWFTCKELRAQDRIEFDAERVDDYGMPAMVIHYELTDLDRATVAAAISSLTRAAQSLGHFAPGGEPRLLPAGSSMHYQGTVRMGIQDDGASVCDPTSRVWGSGNLFVGGNGVIPTATACNPTATTVAMAVISAGAVVDLLSR